MTHLQIAAAFALAGILAATSSAVDAPSGDAIVARVLTVPIRASELEPPKGLRNDSSMSDAAWTEHIRARQLEGRIVEPLRMEFCRAHRCELTSEDRRKILEQLDEGKKKPGAGDPDVDDPAFRDTFVRMMASWKFHKALYERYGGEVISQVLGVNPVGAYRRWLEDEEKRGQFEITTAALRDGFYKAVSGYGGGTMSPEQAREVFSRTPWDRPPR